MRNQCSCPIPNDGSPDQEDRIIQSAVLLHVIVLHPVQVTEAELIRELATDPEDFDERDGIERAVRDLAGTGLLHPPDPFVRPSASAFRAYELFGG